MDEQYKIEPFDYQIKLCEQIIEHLFVKNENCVFLVLRTGFGKSMLISILCNFINYYF